MGKEIWSKGYTYRPRKNQEKGTQKEQGCASQVCSYCPYRRKLASFMGSEKDGRAGKGQIDELCKSNKNCF